MFVAVQFVPPASQRQTRLCSSKKLVSLGVSKHGRLLMALFIYAIYTMHISFRHGLPKGELAPALGKVTTENSFRSRLRGFVQGVLHSGMDGHILHLADDG